jgi:hypothetical protein
VLANDAPAPAALCITAPAGDVGKRRPAFMGWRKAGDRRPMRRMTNRRAIALATLEYRIRWFTVGVVLGLVLSLLLFR